MAKIFIMIGVLFLVIGRILLLFPNALSWFGKLPGDISYQNNKGNLQVHFPIITMILLSIITTIVLNSLNKR